MTVRTLKPIRGFKLEFPLGLSKEAVAAAETVLLLGGRPKPGDRVRDLNGSRGFGTVMETASGWAHSTFFMVLWDESKIMESIDVEWFSPAADVWYA